ncbi:hypothetical protein DR92_4584 (plasmid) [Brucella anthropi]|nr:hypothetical protein DR92_4584 [Brucella anthropi]
MDILRLRYVLVGGGSIFKFRSANSADVNITSGFFLGGEQAKISSKRTSFHWLHFSLPLLHNAAAANARLALIEFPGSRSSEATNGVYVSVKPGESKLF